MLRPHRRTHSSRSRLPAPRALFLACALSTIGAASTLVACEHQAVFPRSPAHGRPSTCPDDRVDPGVGLGPSPGSARCSYADAQGGRLVQLRGTVLLESVGGQGIPVGVEAMRVTVLDADGKQVGRATTDTQGAFSVSLTLGAGGYELLVVNADTGEVLGRRAVRGAGGTQRVIAGLDIVLPVDPRLR